MIDDRSKPSPLGFVAALRLVGFLAHLQHRQNLITHIVQRLGKNERKFSLSAQCASCARSKNLYEDYVVIFVHNIISALAKIIFLRRTSMSACSTSSSALSGMRHKHESVFVQIHFLPGKKTTNYCVVQRNHLL